MLKLTKADIPVALSLSVARPVGLIEEILFGWT